MAKANDKRDWYDIEFVKQLDSKYKCSICSYSLRAPFQTECGHRFCEECIKMEITNGPKVCPIDNSPLSIEKIFRDVFCNRQILGMECYCSGKTLGCTWMGQRRRLQEHYAQCVFFPVDCSNEGCDMKVQRQFLQNHVTIECRFKKTPCPYCHVEIPEQMMETHHNTDCAKLKLPCRMQCGEAIAREDMEHHVANDCPKFEDFCPFDECCTFKGLRAELKKHLEEKSLEHAYTLKNKHGRLQIQNNELQAKIESLNRVQVGTQAAAVGGECAAAFERRVAAVEHQQTLSDVQMAVMETTSYDGNYIWKIEDLERRIHEAVTGETLFIDSPPFYVGRFGYKVCARVYLNGDGMGKNTHLSLFFVVMRGAYDGLLPWPFQRQVTFKLIDQAGGRPIIDNFFPDPSNSCFQRPTGIMNKANGRPLFVPKSVLRSRGYIRKNTVYLQISVDTTGIPRF